MRAADDGDPETIKILLQHGADLNASNEDGDTALKLAKDADNDEAVALLRDAREKPSGQ